MNAIGLIFTIFASIALLTLPRRLAVIPLLMGGLYMTRGQELDIGVHFSVVRILATVGFLRVIFKGEKVAGGLNEVDKLLIIWAIWLILSSAFHTSDAWVFRIGVVWSELGYYFLFRVFVQDWGDVKEIFKILCVLLVPIAILMLLEKGLGKNFFAVLGGVDEIPTYRNGHYRASGPFAHPILAGVVGATCFPMALFLWNFDRIYALLGFFSAGGVVFASTSSGPIMMLLFIIFGLVLWKVRNHMNRIRWVALVGIIALDAVMKDPVYFLMARIDISGGSTGYHRAQLIRSSIEHFDEWWLAGTDYTRHWMATGIFANPNHTDITNHLLAMGVSGGIPLMLLFIMALVAAFQKVGSFLRENEDAPFEQKFLIWTLGAILFGHTWNFFSISLFDQSVIFLYLILACIASMQIDMEKDITQVKNPALGLKRTRYIAKKHVKL